jgi:hypothetical protein
MSTRHCGVDCSERSFFARLHLHYRNPDLTVVRMRSSRGKCDTRFLELKFAFGQHFRRGRMATSTTETFSGENPPFFVLLTAYCCVTEGEFADSGLEPPAARETLPTFSTYQQRGARQLFL